MNNIFLYSLAFTRIFQEFQLDIFPVKLQVYKNCNSTSDLFLPHSFKYYVYCLLLLGVDCILARKRRK